MSTASRKAAKRSTRDGDVSLVADCYREVTSLSRESLDPTSDRRMNELQAALYEATAVLAAAPSVDALDVQAKLTILCARLREHLHPEHRGELLTYLLAESLREDFRLLLLTPERQPSPCREGRRNRQTSIAIIPIAPHILPAILVPRPNPLHPSISMPR